MYGVPPEVRARSKFPEEGPPVEATPGNKSRAASLLEQVPAEGLSAIEKDIIAALRMAEKAPSSRRVLLVVGSGDHDLKRERETLEEIARANRGRAKIFTLGVIPYRENEEFLKRIAHENGGTYRRIEW